MSDRIVKMARDIASGIPAGLEAIANFVVDLPLWLLMLWAAVAGVLLATH